jgi:hypothetical protein
LTYEIFLLQNNPDQCWIRYTTEDAMFCLTKDGIFFLLFLSNETGTGIWPADIGQVVFPPFLLGTGFLNSCRFRKQTALPKICHACDDISQCSCKNMPGLRFHYAMALP